MSSFTVSIIIIKIIISLLLLTLYVAKIQTKPSNSMCCYLLI